MTKDSGSHLETFTAQSAQMREESRGTALQQAYAEAERKSQAAVQREQTIQAQEKTVNDLIPPGATREQLLDYIQQMREEKHEAAHNYYISPEQQAQIDLEQATGRAAVAKAEAEAKKFSDARMLADAAELARQADMVPVHHPNPGQQEQYPAIKSTLGKPAGAPKQLK